MPKLDHSFLPRWLDLTPIGGNCFHCSGGSRNKEYLEDADGGSGLFFLDSETNTVWCYGGVKYGWEDTGKALESFEGRLRRTGRKARPDVQRIYSHGGESEG